MNSDKSFKTIPIDELKKQFHIKNKQYYYYHMKLNFGNSDKLEKDIYISKIDVSDKLLRYNTCFRIKKELLEIFKDLCDHSHPSEYISVDDRKKLEFLRFGYNLLFKYYSDSDRKRYEDVKFTEYVHGTTSIEGNTYTLRETDLTLNEGLTVSGKEKREFFEIENYSRLKKEIETMRSIKITLNLIKRIHKIIMQNIDDDSAGSLRKIDVGIRGASITPVSSLLVEDEMNKLINWYDENKSKTHPIELITIFHQKFEEIHPFIDGNGRVGRELIRLILKKNGYPTIFIDKTNREGYLKALDKGNKGNHKILCDFFLNNLFNYHKDLIIKAKDDLNLEELNNYCASCPNKEKCQID
ncbi:MAG: Fic family protein [Candidatus Aenigmarchaeota archaeon]|nr:Fic family protein [Candidatus Aenigmarchaeota archaeon]